ncbi:MAG: molybdopterin molybdotransferase MoeA [Mariprofundales bacterium]
MSYLAVEEAQNCILEHFKEHIVESVPLNESLNRVLAEDVYANRNHPPYDVSAMDGYAVRFEDLAYISELGSIQLQMIDDIRAGQMPVLRVLQGRSARIMTGAPVPLGADTVIRVEDTELDGDIVSILIPQDMGANIRPLGENLRDGELLLETGTTVIPSVLAILAMVKKRSISVFAKPTVAILSTGDELEGLEEPIDYYKIPDANSYALMAQCQTLGITPILLGIARDNPIEIRAKLTEGLKYDVLLASGGVSVGHHDFMRPMLEELGIQMHFWRVAMRPGHPLAFGTSKTGTVVFGLPGNPVSSMVCFEQFAVPALKRKMGFKKCFRRTITARLIHDMKDRGGRSHFVRVSLTRDNTDYLASITGTQGSGVLMSMVHAEGLMIVPAAVTDLKAGDTVVVQLLQDMDFQSSAGLRVEDD